MGDVLFIGEAPGYIEEKQGQVFVGKTGEEVNGHYLPLAGLRRSNVCITNAIRCLPPGAGGKLDAGRAKDVALLESCAAKHLYPLIEATQPRLLVPLGSFACRAVCPGLDLELQHGMPVDTPWGIPAFPMYHPALGIHEPKKMLYIRTDWQRLRSYINGTLKLIEDTYEPDYQEVTDGDEIRALDPKRPLAGDTETARGGEPFCLTYSQAPGVGRLVPAHRRDLLEQLSSTLQGWKSHILFHNYLYDRRILWRMGIRLPHARVVDTMSVVFQLGNLPQGLKALSYRELGMRMQDFVDVVSPYSRAKVLDYYDHARSLSWPKPDEELVKDEAGNWKVYKPQSLNTKLKRFFTDYGKNPEKDVFAAWDNWESSHAMVEAECGPWPGLCITHVPFEQVLYYACRDADATLRLWSVLQHMRSRVRKVSQEHWRE